jgi:uncharacterized membrane protein (UPF0127 family)
MKAFSQLVLVAIIVLISTFVNVASAFPSVDDKRIEKLKSKKIKVGTYSINAEIADTPETRERGLMYRKSMPSQSGMLFVFDKPQPMAFWMKNTLIPLSIGYFDANRKLIGTYEMAPGAKDEVQPKTYPSNGDALYALEMNKGWFVKRKITVGTELTLPALSPAK